MLTRGNVQSPSHRLIRHGLGRRSRPPEAVLERDGSLVVPEVLEGLLDELPDRGAQEELVTRDLADRPVAEVERDRGEVVHLEQRERRGAHEQANLETASDRVTVELRREGLQGGQG